MRAASRSPRRRATLRRRVYRSRAPSPSFAASARYASRYCCDCHVTSISTLREKRGLFADAPRRTARNTCAIHVTRRSGEFRFEYVIGILDIGVIRARVNLGPLGTAVCSGNANDYITSDLHICIHAADVRVTRLSYPCFSLACVRSSDLFRRTCGLTLSKTRPCGHEIDNGLPNKG